MEDITVRPAQENDFEAVVEVCKTVYSGHDYIPLVFLQWLKDKSRVVFVAELDGKVIGLQSIRIVDDGKTFIGVGLRIHPNYRGRGFSVGLINETYKYVRLHYPSVVRERLTTWSSNAAAIAIQKKYDNRVVLKWDVLAFCIAKDFYFPLPMKTGSSLELKCYSKSDVAQVILDKPVASVLFKQGIHIINWDPFDADRANLDFIVEENDFMLADRETVEYTRTGTPPKSFSHSRIRKMVGQVRWHVSIYGDDPYLFKAHAFEQLKRCHEAVKGEFIFATFQESAYSSHITRFMKDELGLTPADVFELILFENKVHRSLPKSK